MSSSDGRSWVVGYYGIVLDGQSAGYFRAFDGGGSAAEGAAKKEIALQVGLSMAQPLKDWIDASLRGAAPRKSGAIKIAGPDGTVERICHFEAGLISEIGFPACDASAKSDAAMTITISPEQIRYEKGDGSRIDRGAHPTMLHPGSFRLSISGLESASSKVMKVEALTIERKKAQLERDNFEEPGAITFPNLKITLSEEYSHDFDSWFEDSARSGSAVSQEKTGTLEFLDQTRKNVLLELELQGLKATSVSGARAENNKDEIARTTVEMYVEKITARFA